MLLTPSHSHQLNQQRGLWSRQDLAQNHWTNDCYSISAVEPSPLLQLEISKSLKECTAAYLSAPELEMKPSTLDRPNRKIRSYKNRIFNRCNNLLAGYNREFSICNLQIHFSSSQQAAKLKGIFIGVRVKGMMEGKEYKAFEMVIPFIAAFIDRGTGYTYQCSFSNSQHSLLQSSQRTVV